MFSALFIQSTSLHAEMYEVRLQIENIDCIHCSKSIEEALKTVDAVERTKVWPLEGIALVTWKSGAPFSSQAVSKAFERTPFFLKHIDIDAEGIIEEKKGATILKSLPDGTLFYIENRHDADVKQLKDGQSVRLRGRVSNQKGYNYLIVSEVLPENTFTEKELASAIGK